jgi:predicted protein tyrosine phosphatase
MHAARLFERRHATRVVHAARGHAPDEQFRRGLGLALTAPAMPKARMLVHCMMSVARSFSMTYAVLRSLGHSPDDSVKPVEKARILSGFKARDDVERAIAVMEQERTTALRRVPKRR